MMRYLTGPVFRVAGTASSNNPFFILLGMGETYPAAIEAQERYEQMPKRLCQLAGLLVGLALGIIVHPIIGVLAFVVSPLPCALPAVKRWAELRGTALDIAVAARLYGADAAAYERQKAVSRTTYGQFKGWSVERLQSELAKLRPWAAKRAPKWEKRK